MSCTQILDQLVKKLQGCPGGHPWCTGYTNLLVKLANGRDARRKFLQDYPLRANSGAVAALTSGEVYNPGAEYFFRWIGWTLEELGAINAFPLAFENAAGPYLAQFKELLGIAFDDSKSLAEKIDAPWERIPRFGGDKHIAKKIASTYYPDKTLPIFATQRMQAAADLLGINTNAIAGMTVGQQWELLTEALLERKAHHPGTAQNDNVFFMRVLEH